MALAPKVLLEKGDKADRVSTIIRRAGRQAIGRKLLPSSTLPVPVTQVAIVSHRQPGPDLRPLFYDILLSYLAR